MFTDKEGLPKIFRQVKKMLYLGIDIGKNTHAASLLDDKAKPVFKAFSLSNTTDGGESLITKLNAHIKCASDVEIGMEAMTNPASSRSGGLLCRFLLFVRLILRR